jgi:outer membrane usher protein
MLPLAQTQSRARRVVVPALCLCLAACVLPALPATAQPGPTDQVQSQRALLTLSVNQADRGEVLSIIRGGDVLVEVAALVQAGLKNVGGRRETIDGREFVSLSSLAPGVTYEFSERALTLALMAGNAHLASVVLDLRPARPAFEYVRATSGFLNYAFNWNKVGGTDAAIEAGFSAGPALALTTVSWDEDRGFIRGLSNITIDQRERLRRWTIGDSYVVGQTMGSGFMIGGLHIQRDYGLDPYFIQFPTLGLAGTAITPSTVEVYVNGRLVSRQQVSPGSFRLANVPMASGSNDTQVVVRDAFGREQSMASPFYLTTSALARGLHDYDYAVGFERAGGSTDSWEYGPLVAVARHRYGFTDRLTAGFVAEAGDGVVAAGPTMNLRLPVGEMEIAAGVSRAAGTTGAAVSVGFARTARRISFSGRLRSMTSDYTMLALTRPEDRPRFEAGATVGVQVNSRVSLSLQEVVANPHAGQSTGRTSVITGIGLSGRLSAFVNVSNVRTGAVNHAEVFAGLSVALAPYTHASVWGQRSASGSGMMADVQKALPLGPGYGYRARASLGGDALAEGVFAAQGRFGRVEAGEQIFSGRQSPYVSVTGGLVAIGGDLHPTRTVNESFALVRVPDVPGVRTYLNNQDMGRTNRHGDLLVSNLLPYYANRLGISDQDVPLERQVETVEQAVAPPYRGGAVVVFHADQWQAVAGTALLERGGLTVLPSFGEISASFANRAVSSPIGTDGQFFLENLPAGRHPAVIVFGDVRCRLTLNVPADGAASVVRLGVVRCTVPEVK